MTSKPLAYEERTVEAELLLESKAHEAFDSRAEEKLTKEAERKHRRLTGSTFGAEGNELVGPAGKCWNNVRGRTNDRQHLWC